MGTVNSLSRFTERNFNHRAGCIIWAGPDTDVSDCAHNLQMEEIAPMTTNELLPHVRVAV